MQRYIGTKILNGESMSLGEYNALRGWDMPTDEDPNKEGYLVEYPDDGEPNHEDYANYISWSPKEQFENAYRKTKGSNFGLAVEAMKKGMKATRMGWNGKGMVLQLQPPSDNSEMTFPYPYFTIPDCEEGERKIPYVPTIVDVMSDDWIVVE
jgi:hypothetical protein